MGDGVVGEVVTSWCVAVGQKCVDAYYPKEAVQSVECPAGVP